MRRGLAALLLLVGTLIPFILISSVYADPAPPYSSHPTSHEISAISVTNPGNAYDGDLATYSQFNYGKGPAGYYQVITFATPTWVSPPPIARVDFKMKYSAQQNTAGEMYRIDYYVGTAGPVVLQDWTGDAYATATRTWLTQPEPSDGAWSWTDVSDIKFRVSITEKAGGSADTYFSEYEAWVEVTLAEPVPPAKLAIDPAEIGALTPGSTFSVDVKVTDVYAMVGYEFTLSYKTSVLTATSFFSYYPFSVPWGTPRINDTAGYVYMAYSMSMGEPVGLWGGGTVARIDFIVDAEGGSLLDLHDTVLGDLYYVAITHEVFDGIYNRTLGDINSDGNVDCNDLFVLARAYGSSSGQPAYNPDADLNGDDDVDYDDLMILVENYGTDP